MMTRRFTLFLLAAGALTSSVHAESLKSLSGTVMYRERMALPPNAVLTVRLEDVSLADAPAKVVAESWRDVQGAPPYSYSLQIPDAEPGRRYQLQAEIRAGEQLLFTSSDALSPDKPDILVTRVSATADAGPYGNWVVQNLNGKALPVMARPPGLTVGQDGRISGSGGCNRLMGHAAIKGETIEFKPFAMTRMACIGPGMDVENTFVKTLEAVRFWSIDGKGHLSLMSGDKNVSVVLVSDHS